MRLVSVVAQSFTAETLPQMLIATAPVFNIKLLFPVFEWMQGVLADCSTVQSASAELKSCSPVVAPVQNYTERGKG